MGVVKRNTLRSRTHRVLFACGLAILGFICAMVPSVSGYADTLVGGSVPDDVVVAEVETAETYIADASDSSDDPESLFDAYAEMRLKEALPQSTSLSVQAVPSPNLTTAEQSLLAQLKTRVAAVARFNTSADEMSTEFEVPLSSIGLSEVSWTPDELGVSANLVDSKLPDAATQAAVEKGGIPDVEKVLDVLRADCPFDLYWYDKTTSVSYSYGIYYSHNSTQWTRLTWSGPIVVKMPACAEYRGSATYTVCNKNATRITTAINTAEGIVNLGIGKNLNERLAFYKNEICARVSYNTNAAGGGVPYGDPWQLISVFDGDTSTNVVCEGYSKAFQYLFDMTGFTDASCYLVTGYVEGGTGAGRHMWNVVHMDEHNYLVDVTNSDAGTAGSSGQLFLASSPDGNIDDGYRFLANTTSVDGRILYQYDEGTRQLYRDTDLMIYGAVEKTLLTNTNTMIEINGVYTYNGGSQTPNQSEVIVSYGGTALEYDTDYTYSASNNVNAGTATLTVVGKGRYKGTATKAFEIGKCPVNVPNPISGLTYDGSNKVGVSGEARYTVKNGSGTEAGAYEATVTLVDPINYKWSMGDSTSSRSVTWQIAQSKALTLRCADANLEYTGSPLKAAATPSVSRGTTVEYSVNGGNSWSQTIPTRTSVGETTIMARATNKNYENASGFYALRVRPKRVDAPKARTGLVYNGGVQSGVSGSSWYRVDNGSASNAGSYTAIAKLSDTSNCQWSDGTVSDKRIAWSIAPRSVAVVAENASKKVGDPDPQLSATIDNMVDDYEIDCSLTRDKGETPGVYRIVVSGNANQGNYRVSFVNARFTITEDKQSKANASAAPAGKVANPMTVSLNKKKLKVKLSKVKKKKQVVSGAIIVKNAKGKVTYSRIKKGSDKKLSINKKTGKITVKKGTKKGKHKIKVKVTASGDNGYYAASKVITVTINVK